MDNKEKEIDLQIEKLEEQIKESENRIKVISELYKEEIVKIKKTLYDFQDLKRKLIKTNYGNAYDEFRELLKQALEKQKPKQNYEWSHDSYIKKNSDCYHQQCSTCNGTGIKQDGQLCIHMISCPCKMCVPYCL